MMFLPLEEAKRMQEQRLLAVKRAYWQATPEKAYEVWKMQTALSIARIMETPTIEQAESVFMMLPRSVFGSGLAFGFNDREVEESLYNFFINNRNAVIEMLTATARQDTAIASESTVLQIVSKI